LIEEVRLTEVELSDVLFRDVTEYFEGFGSPLRLATLSQRHGKRVKGAEISQLVKGDSRLLMLTLNSDGRVVLPRQAFEGFVKDMSLSSGLTVDKVRTNMLMSWGVKL
jgi:hypothetical protein